MCSQAPGECFRESGSANADQEKRRQRQHAAREVKSGGLGVKGRGIGQMIQFSIISRHLADSSINTHDMSGQKYIWRIFL
jgi:hypothetical protein